MMREQLWKTVLPGAPAEPEKKKTVKTYFASLDLEDDRPQTPERHRVPPKEILEHKADSTEWRTRIPTNNKTPGTLRRKPSAHSIKSIKSSTSWARMSSPSLSSCTGGERGMKRVRVAVRCRPPVHESDYVEVCQEEKEQLNEYVESPGFIPAVDVEISQDDCEEFKGRVVVNCEGGGLEKKRTFPFDHVFGPASQQHEVYRTVAEPIVSEVLKGYNGAILAYGQTGTGKTHTMGILERISPQSQLGIIPSALRQIFQQLVSFSCGGGRCRHCSWQVKLSFLQIYLETLQDLLAPLEGGQVTDNLVMREDPKTGFYVQGLRTFPVKNYAEAVSLINLGLENRRMAATTMNTSSSRSHTVLTVDVEISPCRSNTHFATENQLAKASKVRAKLRLVDLAGSERVKTRGTMSSKTQVKEAKSINVSLSALGNVVAALASREEKLMTSSSHASVVSDFSESTTNSSHIPYRDSKLTKLLQDTLGGKSGCNTALIATVGPSQASARETVSTLQFASRCMKVRSEATAQFELNYAEMCAALQQRLDQVQQEFSEREELLRQTYEDQITTLKRQIRFSDLTGTATLSAGSAGLFYDIYENFMSLGREFRQRLDQQRKSLVKFVETDFPKRVDVPSAPNGKIFTPPITIATVKAALKAFSSPAPQDKATHRIARALNIPVDSIDQQLLEPKQLSRDTSPARLALHAKILSKALQFEAEAAHNLLNRMMDEIVNLYINGAQRDEDLVNCSQVLKYLLKTNAQLRAEMCSSSASQEAGSVRSFSMSTGVPETEEASSTCSGSEDNRSEFSALSQLDRFLLRK